MDKETIVALINALKTLEDISRRRNESMIANLMMQNDINLMLTNYTNGMFSKIIKDLSTLKEKTLNPRDFKNYSVELDKLLKGLEDKTKGISAKIERSVSEFQLSKNDLQEKISEFNFILDEIRDSLK